MKCTPLNGTSENRSPSIFFVLVFVLSIPIWAIGPVAERFLSTELPTDLPISSLMAFVPVTVAALLVRREKGLEGVKTLLKRASDYKRIIGKAWYVPILFLMPVMMVLQYGLMKVMQVPLSDPRIPVLMVPVSFVVFFIAALGEEIGWQGYAFDSLQDRWNALTASLILGTVHAVWHIVPLIQMNQTPAWIAWQCLNIVVVRTLTVWLYNNTGKSVFAAALFHAMYNVSTVLLPSYGWQYDPAVAFIILTAAAATITLFWGPETLAGYRYSEPGRDVQTNVAN